MYTEPKHNFKYFFLFIIVFILPFPSSIFLQIIFYLKRIFIVKNSCDWIFKTTTIINPKNSKEVPKKYTKSRIIHVIGNFKSHHDQNTAILMENFERKKGNENNEHKIQQLAYQNEEI